MMNVLKEKLNLLGVNIAPLNPSKVLDELCRIADGDSYGHYVCVTGVHGVIESLHDNEILAAHNEADLCVPDGMPLSWAGWFYGFKEMDRVYGPDLMLRLLETSAQKKYTCYFYGGKEGIAAELKQKMEQRFPGLKIVGTFTPPFRPLNEDEEKKFFKEINTLKPDFLFIGISSPKQELLMRSLKDKVRAKVMLGVGAAFDFLTGNTPQAPRWMQRSGLEWLYRLISEPKRLWKRYLYIVPSFISLFALQIFGILKRPSCCQNCSGNKPVSMIPILTLFVLLGVTSAGLYFYGHTIVDNTIPLKSLPSKNGHMDGRNAWFCHNYKCLSTVILPDTLYAPKCPACGSSMIRDWSLGESIQLPADTILMKKAYVYSNSSPIMVMAVISGNDRTSIHRPQMCVTAQGHTIVKERDAVLNIRSGMDLPIKIMDIQMRIRRGSVKDVSFGHFIYWFTDGVSETRSHWKRTFTSIYDAVIKGKTRRWAYISVIEECKTAEDDVSDETKDFIRQLYKNVTIKNHEK